MEAIEVIGLVQAIALGAIWFRLGGVLADHKNLDRRVLKLEEKNV